MESLQVSIVHFILIL